MGERETLTVQKTATGQIGVHHAVLSSPFLLDIIAEAGVGNSAKHFADLALLNELAHLDTDREVACPHSLHKEEVLLAGSFAQNLGLGCVDSEGLFAQDILARLQTQHHILIVVRVGSSNIDDVDIGIRDELLVRSVGGTGSGDADGRNKLVGLVLGGR